MWAPAEMRRRLGKGGKPPTAGAPARAGYNGDDDDWSYMTVGTFCCLFLVFAAGVATIVLAGILMHRSVPRSALSDLCDDSNPCTWDVLETVHGTTAGVCSHYNYQNDGNCTDACYDSATCQDGTCKGTCRGHCSESNALDCPIVSAVNLTALLGHGRLSTDTVTMSRECLLSGCLYSIVMDLNNATLDDKEQTGFVHSVRRIFDYLSANTSVNSSSIGSHITDIEDEMFEFRIVCMSLIHPDDRDCLQAIRFEYDDHGTVNCTAAGDGECLLDIECSYMFKCTDPPSYTGKLEFPILSKMPIK